MRLHVAVDPNLAGCQRRAKPTRAFNGRRGNRRVEGWGWEVWDVDAVKAPLGTLPHGT